MSDGALFDLRGEVALVTGAGQGVGAQIATTLAAQGAAVAVNDLFEERAASVTNRIRTQGGRSLAVSADVTDRSDVDAMVETTSSELGAVSILVNNAGVPADGFRIARFLDTTRDDWDRYLNLNLIGTLHCTQAVLGPMLEHAKGRIISIVSDAALIGEPLMAPYAAAKAGVIGFTRALAKEVGPGWVTCNCVSLGSIEGTESRQGVDDKQLRRYAVPRLGRPADVAATVLWLASQEAEWVTGQTVAVNGGYCMT